MQKYAFEVVKGGAKVAAADDLDSAQKIADLLGGKVKEAVLFRVQGSTYGNATSIIVGNDNLSQLILDAIGPSGKGKSFDLGNVEITIKALPDVAGAAVVVDEDPA